MSANTAETLNKYPALAEMGIIRFHEISHYTLGQNSGSEDVLRIKYARAKGSLLPSSRKYKFGRSMKTVIADGGTARMEHTYEISPFLLKAVSELDSLVTLKESGSQSSRTKAEKSNAKVALITELDQIDQMVNEQMSLGDTSAVKAKLAIMRQQLQAL